MERPIVLLWIQVISVLFLGISLFILVAGAPIYLLAMAMGGGQTMLLGLLIMLCLIITMIIQVIAWIKLARNSKNAYSFLKISWVCLSISLFFILSVSMSLTNMSEFGFVAFSIIVILTHRLFFSENVINYFKDKQKDNERETSIISQ
ncbi:hypothetical protein GWI68_06940 [Proteus sp. G2669]|uniref:hypothetical protein n=1 Tax=Proteus sp. G2669 TaxID=2698881 RepID=UPI0014129FA4|nr:hypothetical protein [Proteus sp. G2669]NBM54532.1 hypothetical protein [Proteus sp. G2669]